MEQPRVMTPKVKSYKISAKCEVELHPYNVVCFKNCLNKSAQKRLLMECGRIMEIGNNPNLISRGKFSAISKKAVPVLFWNWPAVKESLKYKETYQPSDLLDFTARLFDIARDKIKAEEDSGMVKYANSRDLGFPPQYSPNALYGILYPYGGTFIPHVDGARGWALAISIGEAATFFVCETERGERIRMRVNSGDAVIFKGGKLYHGVEEIFPDSAPNFWYDRKVSNFPIFEMARFNLQFRDPKNDRLEYYPVFQAMEPSDRPKGK